MINIAVLDDGTVKKRNMRKTNPPTHPIDVMDRAPADGLGTESILPRQEEIL